MEPNARTMYEYGGYEIRVWASRNERGAWVSDVEIYRDGRRVLAAVPETVSPEWGTEEECVRDAIEQGRDLIDRGDVARCRP